MTALAITTEFDYGTLDAETRVVVQQKTGEIRERIGGAARNVVEIGERLLIVKGHLPHGDFGGWLQGEFGWSEWTARKMMSVADRFKTVNFTDLRIGPSALYLLASSETPDDVREQFIEQAKAGEKVTHDAVKKAVAKRKPKKPSRPKAAAKPSKDETGSAPETTPRTPATATPTPPEPEVEDIDEVEAATTDAPADADRSQPWAAYNADCRAAADLYQQLQTIMERMIARDGKTFASWLDKPWPKACKDNKADFENYIVTGWDSKTANRPDGRNFVYFFEPDGKKKGGGRKGKK